MQVVFQQDDAFFFFFFFFNIFLTNSFFFFISCSSKSFLHGFVDQLFQPSPSLVELMKTVQHPLPF